jgi:hypothetical protein
MNCRFGRVFSTTFALTFFGCRFFASDLAAWMSQQPLTPRTDFAGASFTVRIVFVLGLRSGEMFALRWNDKQGNNLRIDTTIVQEALAQITGSTT